MTAPLRIGLTGGIASGKSTIARLFAARGVPVIDTDQIARDVVEPGQPALAAVVVAFGDDILAADDIILNDGNEAALEPQVAALDARYRELAGV